jgi:hypothetical protein
VAGDFKAHIYLDGHGKVLNLAILDSGKFYLAPKEGYETLWLDYGSITTFSITDLLVKDPLLDTDP